MYNFYTVKGKSSFPLLIAMLALPQLVGLANILIIGDDVNIYNSIAKPSFAPPPYYFAPIWIFLYLLMGYASYRIALFYNNQNHKNAYTIYLLQLFLNFLWPILFFEYGLYEAALIEIMILAVLIFFCVMSFNELDSLAGVVMVPYLAWVIFATILNYFIFILN